MNSSFLSVMSNHQVIYLNPRKIEMLIPYTEESTTVFFSGSSPIRVDISAPRLAQAIDQYFNDRTLP